MSSLHTFNNSSGSVYERLYKDGEKYAMKKQMKALRNQELAEIENEELDSSYEDEDDYSEYDDDNYYEE